MVCYVIHLTLGLRQADLVLMTYLSEVVNTDFSVVVVIEVSSQVC